MKLTCCFDWPGTMPGSRRICDGEATERVDGNPACRAHHKMFTAPKAHSRGCPTFYEANAECECAQGEEASRG